MSRGQRSNGLKGLRQAFDEVRFGDRRTLNLRDSLPTAQVAMERAESWLRQQQVDRAEEGLGVKHTAMFLQGEMLKQFGAIAATVGNEPGREGRLRTAIRAALDQHE